MKTILGLDLGVGSIGWAIVTEDNENQTLVDTGVRVIPIDTETSNNFSKGVATSKNQDRRLKRSARRNNHRYKLRRQFLTQHLKSLNLFPINSNLFELSALELYGLRNKAINEKIQLEELARIWYHLNQKRGYIDSRKGSTEEADTKYVEKIKESSKNIYLTHKTVGSYFFDELKKDPLRRIKSGDDKNNIFLIEDYKKEFDLIWDTQKKYYPEILNESNYEIIRNQIIYFKRKLKSQKHLIGTCRFEKHHKVLPISSPLALEIRIWQDINNLIIKSKYNEIFNLTLDQKIELFEYLNNNQKITEKELLKKFNYPATKNEFSINFEKEIKGNSFKHKLNLIFKKHNSSFKLFEKFDPILPDFDKHPYFQLWHLLYSVEESKDLKESLKIKFEFSDELIDDLIKIPIKNDFASLSSRAARKILPFLRQGKMYSEACLLAGYNHSNSINKEDNENRELLEVQDLKHIKPNELRNPTVEKILNQLINLLKALDNKGYKFDEIRIELARDLKKNAKQRQKITDQNRKNENENKSIEALLRDEHGFKNVSKRDIEKYKLWKEFDGRSPYEPNIGIELQDLFDKAKYEIEHIIPKSRYFDDSFNNKTIARVHINKSKDNSTAFDFMSSRNDEDLHQYLEFIKHSKVSETKKRYLKMPGDQIPEDFINRQLNETRYIAKETLKILKNVCRNVFSTSGSVTDYLKHHWGYDNVLMDLNFERVSPDEIIIKEINGQKRKVIKNWDKRLDHRHHALDAIIIACTKQSIINTLNRLNSSSLESTNLKSISIKNSAPFDFQTVKNKISEILVSFKPGKKVATLKKVNLNKWKKKPGNFEQVMLVPRGPLHEESVYGMIKKYSKPIPLEKIIDINSIAVDWQKKLVEDYVKNHENNWEKAKKNLKKSPIVYDSNKILDKAVIFFEKPVKKYNLQYSSTNKFDLKAAESIVNENVKKIVIHRLSLFDNKPELAFKNLTEDPLYLNKDNNIVIKSVRCYTKTTDDQIKPENSGYFPLHVSKNGKTLNLKNSKNLSDLTPIDYVKGGSNHHIAIYEDLNGERYEEVVSFFEAFERKRNNEAVIRREHPLGNKLITSLQQNEMFVFGISEIELKELIAKRNYSVISKYLYRVQKIASKDYTFRHHLETKLNDDKNSREQKKYLRITSLKNFSGIKLRVNQLNTIKIIHD